MFWVALILACMADQTRLQPSFFSLGLLMIPPTGNQRFSVLARWHLSCLWFYAGFHKLLSPGYLFPETAWMLKIFMDSPPAFLEFMLRILVAGFEIALAILIWRRPTLAGVGAFFLHGSIFLYLSPVFRNWNEAVWPWNITLALVGLYIVRDRGLYLLFASRGLAKGRAGPAGSPGFFRLISSGLLFRIKSGLSRL